VIRGIAVEKFEGVGNQREYGIEAFNRTLRRARGVDDEGSANGSRSTSRQRAKGVRRAHQLAKAWRLALEHGKRRFRSDVARREARAAGRDDESRELASEVTQGLGDRDVTVGDDSKVDDLKTRIDQSRLEEWPRSVDSTSGGDRV